MRLDEAFFSRVGHDLRGELATVLAGVHFLLRYEPGLSPPARQMLERVNAAGQRLKRLLDELGDAAWATDPKEALAPARSADVGAAITRAVARVRPLADAHEVVLDTDAVAKDLGELAGDTELLEGAFVYALEFAVARSNAGRVALAARRSDRGVVVTVTDRAGPLPPDRLARLTEPFFEKEILPRDVAQKPVRERLGLGLAICKGIVFAHGGSLSTEIAPQGDGVRLVCRIPAGSEE
jgi:K+-sensing histidine kinase KdpD